MKQITQEEVYKMVEKDKEETKKIINDGGRIIYTIIYEKDKVTTIKRIEPVNGKPTSSKIIQTKESITLQKPMKEMTLEQLNNLTLKQFKNIKVKDIKSTPVADTTDVKH